MSETRKRTRGFLFAKSLNFVISHSNQCKRSIALGKSHKPSEQPFPMHQPDSRIKKNTMLKDFDYFNSHTKAMESAWKRPRQANGWSSNTGTIFSFKPFLENFFYCFLTKKHCCFRDVYRIGFIMTSVSVHVTFKSGKIMHLSCYFSYWPHP